MPDFLISVLVAGGMTLRWGLVLTGWVLLTCLFSLIHMFNFRLSGSVRVGMLSIWLTLFAGGIGAFYYVWEKPDWYTLDNLTNSVFQHGPDHVLYWVKGMSAYWFSLPAHILFPQRTVQHAYPLAVSAMLCIWAGMTGCPPPNENPAILAPFPSLKGGAEETGEQRYLKEVASTPRRSKSAGKWAGNDSPPSHRKSGNDSPPPSKVEGSETSQSSAISYGTKANIQNRAASKGGARGSSGGPNNNNNFAPESSAPPATPTKALSLSSVSVGGAAEVTSASQQFRLFAFAGFLTGLIPLMQPHSYVSLATIILVAAGLQTASLTLSAALGTSRWKEENSRFLGRAEWKDVLVTVYLWLVYGAVAISMGIPQFWKHFVHRVSFGVGTRGNGFVRLSTAWEEEGKGETMAYMWFKALGIFMPLYLFSFLLLRTRQQRSFWAGFLTLFLVCNFIMFQPWHLDNTKLFYVFIFGASGYVALTLDTLLLITANSSEAAIGGRLPAGAVRVCGSWVGWILTCAAFIVLTFSGAMATWREMLNHAKLYDDIDFDVAEWIKEKTPTDAIFLHDITQSNHIRVESSLAGRQVAHGFAGWLHSHGIDASARRNDLVKVLGGAEGAVAALRTHNISYITVDAGSKNNFNYAFLDDVTDFVATNGKYSIFKVIDSVRLGKWKPRPCRDASQNAGKEECLAAGCWFHRQGVCEDKPRKKKVEDCKQANQDACRNENCVWVANYPGPWCQKPGWGKPADIPMLRPGQPGSDCGWHNMGIQDCVDKGCVWKTPSDPCVCRSVCPPCIPALLPSLLSLNTHAPSLFRTITNAHAH